MAVNNTSPPVISGTARVGNTLSTTTGTWTHDLDFLTYSYQWLRCDAAGANCVDIVGATSPSYVLTGSDVGSRIRSEVTATEDDYPTPPPPGDLWSLPDRPRLPESTGALVPTTTANFAANLAAASAGDILVLAAGNYSGLSISKAGTATDPITIRGQAGVRFIATSSYSLRLNSGARYLRFEDIVITDPAGSSSACVYFNGCQDIELLRCTIHGSGSASPGGTAGVQGIFSDASSARCQVWDSRIHHVGVAPKFDHGWYMSGDDHVLANSLVYEYRFGFGVQLYSNMERAIIANCTIVGGMKSSIVTGGTQSVDHLIVNSILVDNGESAINTLSGSARNVSRNILVFDPTTRGSTGMTYTSVLTSDPLFVNAGAFDFHLQGASPAIGVGDEDYMPPTDIDGDTRVTPALGCYAA